MGNDTGEIFYGAEISRKDYENLFDDKWNYKKELEEKYPTIEAYEPYETEEYYILISESFNRSFNGGTRLKKAALIVKPGWNMDLIKYFEENNIKIIQEVGWYLVGHYD